MNTDRIFIPRGETMTLPMLKTARVGLLLAAMNVCLLAIQPQAQAEEVKLAEGKLTMAAPESWEKKQPRTRIVDVEYGVPAKEAKTDAARLTMMASGGGVQANIDRWYGQFEQPNNKATKDVAKVEKLELSGLPVHVVDISGKFKDQPRGPFGPTVVKENYRMLGAIIETKNAGTYYVKLYGPAETVHENEKEFMGLIKSLKAMN
jgi:hypothetical protein